MAGSTDLITYLNYISNWENESDTNIDKLIAEHNLFVRLGDFDPDSAINEEFATIIDMATEVQNLTIAADAIQMAADAAAVASFWSFGLGMAAFIGLEAAEAVEKAVISSKSKELNNKLNTADTAIASKISTNVNDYVMAYKSNNNLIVAQAPKGIDLRECRSILMQFMARVERQYKGKGGLTAANFKQLAGSARIAYNSTEINKVYDALDNLNLSAKADADIKKFIDALCGINCPRHVISLVQGVSIAIASYKMNIANKTIEEYSRAAEIPLEEIDASAFDAMDACGKFAGSITIIMSVADVVLNIIDIVNVVEQTKKMVDELKTKIKPNYKSYYDGIKAASEAYNKAIATNQVVEGIFFNDISRSSTINLKRLPDSIAEEENGTESSLNSKRLKVASP